MLHLKWDTRDGHWVFLSPVSCLSPGHSVWLSTSIIKAHLRAAWNNVSSVTNDKRVHQVAPSPPDRTLDSFHSKCDSKNWKYLKFKCRTLSRTAFFFSTVKSLLLHLVFEVFFFFFHWPMWGRLLGGSAYLCAHGDKGGFCGFWSPPPSTVFYFLVPIQSHGTATTSLE